VVPQVEVDIATDLRELENNVAKAIADFDLRGATRLVCEAVASLNRDLEDSKPWAVAKEVGPRAEQTLDTLLARYVPSARAIAGAVAPIVPTLSARLLERLVSSSQLPTLEPAFARIESP
jgi:methionyl-tRNA synthetase